MYTEITLKQISHLSGFSISTVSKALNDKFDISNKTKGKIQELAKSFNYVRNNSALALKIKRTKIIAIIVPQINSIYSGIISSIEENAFQKGYRILILQSLKSEERELECINNVRDGSVDGLVIIKPFQKINNSTNKLSMFTNSVQIPIVIEEVDSLKIDSIKVYIIGKKLLNKILNKIEGTIKS